DLAQDLAHRLLDVGVDDARAAGEVAVLGGVAAGVALAGDAALPHQVDDQLQLVQHLEVGDLRLVAGLHQHLEAGLHQGAGATAQHRLLTEQVGLGLLLEGGLDDTGASTADAGGVGQRQRLGVAGGVLLGGDQARHALAVHELPADQVPRPLRRHHRDVDVGRRLDEAVADVEAVAEEQGVALLQVRRDLLGVDLPLLGVGRQDHDQVGFLDRLSGRQHPQAFFLGLGLGLGALVQTDADVDTGVPQAQGVGVALAAVTDDRDLAALHDAQIGVRLVEDFSCHGFRGSFRKFFGCRPVVAGCPQVADQRTAEAVMEHGPRPIAIVPDWTSSRMPYGSSIRSNASSLSLVPVASTVSASGDTSTTLARNSWTVSNTWLRTDASARTLTSSSSRCTEASGSSSTILITLTSLLSCLVTCSSGWSPTDTTMVIREMSGCSVGPTARDSMLKLRRENSPETRARTPGTSSTRTLSVCRLIDALTPRPRTAGGFRAPP